MSLFYGGLRDLKYRSLFYFKTLIYLRQRLSGQLFSAGKNGVILNCGGPRSGSTLLNMIIKEILLIKLGSEDNYVDNSKELSRRLSTYTHFSLIKTHRYFSNIQSLIRKGQVIAFMTHRDIRDVTVSLCQKGWVDDVREFIASRDLKQIAFSSIAYAEVEGMNVMSYQQLMDQPRQSISFVAGKLGVDLTEEQLDRIERSVSKDNVSRKIDQIDGGDGAGVELDVASGLHKDHIKSGKWREFLNAEDAQAIAEECREYMTMFDYANE